MASTVWMKDKTGKTVGVNSDYVDKYAGQGYTVDDKFNQKVYGDNFSVEGIKSSTVSKTQTTTSTPTSTPKNVAPAKTIDDYKADYESARVKGDTAGMTAANQAANALRGLGNVVTANKDIEYIAGQNKSNSLPPSAQAINYALNPNDVSKYSNNYMTEINRRTALQNTLTNEKDKTDNLTAIQALTNARTEKIKANDNLSDYKYQPVGEAWDLGRGIMQGTTIGGWAYNENLNRGTETLTVPNKTAPSIPRWQPYDSSIPGLTQKELITGLKVNISELLSAYQSAKDPELKSELKADLDNAFDELKEYKGGTWNKNVYDRYNPTDFEYGGKYNNPPEKPEKPERESYNNNYASDSINNLDQYRKMAMQILKPQFDKSVDEQMKQFTNRMLGQGFQGQLPGEEMRAKIMSDMQADFESQVYSLAQQLMRQDIEDSRWEAEFGLKQDSLDFEKALKQQELDWKKEDRGYDKENQAIDLDYKKWQLDDSKKKSTESSEDRLRRITQEKEDRDWTTFQRDKEKELYEIELNNKRLDYNLRLETDPYKQKLLEQEYQMNKLNMEKVKADIDYIRTQKGKIENDTNKITKNQVDAQLNNLPVQEAVALLEDNAFRTDYIERYGLSAYNAIYNSVTKGTDKSQSLLD